MTIARPYFMTFKNIMNVLRQISLIAILAIGEGMIIITAGIDLSVGAVVGILGGLGSALGECISECRISGPKAVLHRIGLQDTFGESGTADELLQKHGLDPEGITNSVLGLL
jgi:predicted ABC-type sugar transport system permease subunit